MKLVSMFVVVAACLLSGCAFKSAPYGASVKNVEAIKASSVKPVAVSTFQSA